jgi:hypothetical protein
VKEIKLTEKEWEDIFDRTLSNYCSWNSWKYMLKEANLIAKDKIETAIEEFIKKNGKSDMNWMIMNDNERFCCFNNQYKEAMNIIKLFEDKIKELEK